jgi:hypothetical protein
MNENRFRDLMEGELIKHLGMLDEEMIVNCAKEFTNRFYDESIEDIATLGEPWLISYFKEIKQVYIVMLIKSFIQSLFVDGMQEKMDSLEKGRK